MVLPRNCTMCGQVLQPKQNFCNNCGTPVAMLSSPPLTPVAATVQTNVANTQAQRRKRFGWGRAIRLSLLLLILILIGVVILTAFSYDRGVSIQDQARVLNTSQVQQAASDLPYALDIFTTKDFAGSTNDFTSHYSTSDSTTITIAIDTVHRYLAISGGSSVALSNDQYRSAVSVFHAAIHQSDYTGATIAAIEDMKRSLALGVFAIDIGKPIRLNVYHLVGAERMNTLLTSLGIVLVVIFASSLFLTIIWSILRFFWGIVGLLTGHGTSFFPRRKEGGDDNDGDSGDGDSGSDGGGASGDF